MDALRKPLKALLVVAGLLLAATIGLVLFLFIFLYTPSDVSEGEREAILNIRDACAEPMEQAYWLMLDHVSEPDGMESYYMGNPEEWEPEAYAFMLDAGQLAQGAVGKAELEHMPFTFFHPGGESGQWYMLLDLPVDTSFRYVQLIYSPFDVGAVGDWKPIENHPHWYYRPAANV